MANEIKRNNRNPNVQFLSTSQFSKLFYSHSISFDFLKFGEIINIRTKSSLILVACSSHAAEDDNTDQNMQPPLLQPDSFWDKYCHYWTFPWNFEIFSQWYSLNSYLNSIILLAPLEVTQFIFKPDLGIFFLWNPFSSYFLQRPCIVIVSSHICWWEYRKN